MITDERLGMPLEEAIRRVAMRMASRDLEQVGDARRAPADDRRNAAEVLDVVVATVRERADIRRLVRTLDDPGADGSLDPDGAADLRRPRFWAIQPDIVGPMWRSSGGQVALVIAAGMVAAGSFFIQRIIEIEV